MEKMNPPQISGTLRKFALRVPAVISECSGIIIQTILRKESKAFLFRHVKHSILPQNKTSR